MAAIENEQVLPSAAAQIIITGTCTSRYLCQPLVAGAMHPVLCYCQHQLTETPDLHCMVKAQHKQFALSRADDCRCGHEKGPRDLKNVADNI